MSPDLILTTGISSDDKILNERLSMLRIYSRPMLEGALFLAGLSQNWDGGVGTRPMLYQGDQCELLCSPACFCDSLVCVNTNKP